MWIDELAGVMPPPAAHERGAPATPQDWARAEAGLGHAIPADFRAFVDRWGPGRIGDFLGLDTPAPGYHPVMTLPGSALSEARAYDKLREHHPASHPWPVFPQPGSFLAFGTTDNGDHLGWIVDEGDPGNWPVAVVDDEYSTREVFEDLRFGPFLLELVTGRLRPRAFPDDLWDSLPLSFTPLAASDRFDEGRQDGD